MAVALEPGRPVRVCQEHLSRHRHSCPEGRRLTITHDPLTLSYGGKDLWVDLGAERVAIGAEKGDQKIAVEIQSFLNRSQVRDLQEAVGQYEVYRTILATKEPDRPLILAVPRRVHETIQAEKFGQFIVAQLKLRLLIFDEKKGKVVQWIN
jgi:hypothetical protein